tara:strand:- start:6075 stop:9977 length:3903 start_codon:yes stop_codon:yes gene_type:complete
MKSSRNTALFKIYIDTGGTFTDCLAITPELHIHRIKVLSSSAIRSQGHIGKDGKSIHTEISKKYPDGFFSGYSLHLLDSDQKTYSITHSSHKDGMLIIGQKLKNFSDEPVNFEIQSPEEAPVLASRLITSTALSQNLPPIQMRLSTTKGTNALLERTGGKTLFLITAGFKDLLHIRNQQRPDLFSLNIKKPIPYYDRIIEVSERLDSSGLVLKKIDLNALKERIEPILPDFDAVAVCFMHSYLNPDHELQVGALLEELGVKYVSCSSQLNPTIKIVPRSITADLNAYLTAPMQNYLDEITQAIGPGSLKIMNSAGALTKASHYKPKDGLFSGPAGGVIGAMAIAKRVSPDLGKIITFDMGGTSTDVSRIDSDIEFVFEHTVGEATLQAPAIDIETVAAGGGSICDFDGQSLTVGPESAGANPGPACYGNGGPFTITDVNLLTGRLQTSNLPITVNPEAAAAAFNQLLIRINKNRDTALSKEVILYGYLDIINERMAQVIRQISIQKGFDPADYTIVAFGGAGAQHALSVAQKLHIKSVLVPSDAGLLSAYGLQQSLQEEISLKQILMPIDECMDDLPKLFKELDQNSISSLENQGINQEEIMIKRRVAALRFLGQDHTLELEWDSDINLKKSFEDAYNQQYGHWIDDRIIEVESIRVIASEKVSANNPSVVNTISNSNNSKTKPPSTDQLTEILYHNKYHQAPVYEISDLTPSVEITGPAMILHPHSTTVIEEGWSGTLLGDGTWNLEYTAAKSGLLHDKPKSPQSEEIQLQLYINRFSSIADQMGEMLQRTALSVNIKERLDYSCALLDPQGYLVVNAPHIPVHLGAMGSCVRTVLEEYRKNPNRFYSSAFKNKSDHLSEGDVIITNHPAFGGSHLPDLNVITPVFYENTLIGFVANRAHHAEIGGKRPGSMPPDAQNLAEEGIVIPPLFLAKEGNFRWDEVKEIFESGPWPSRSVKENLADLRAAVAANHRGVQELKKLADIYGKDEISLYMNRLKEYASHQMRQTIGKIPDGKYQAEEILDDGFKLAVKCTVKNQSMKIDFSGSSEQHPGNLNANPSIVNSVIIYLLRLMIDEPLPLNDGLLEPIEICLPNGMLNPHFSELPEECPAVVGGNVETSQRLTDTLIKAFGLTGCSYGTMNNVLFGNGRFGYYETIAGGTGAGEGFNGADAVHQHMTNTRATDPEILEHRYPVRLDRYEINNNSGGAGKWSGGNGLTRILTFLQPVSLSVLTQHRVTKPFGLKGGLPGNCGEQWIERTDGSRETLQWVDGKDLNSGDRFVIVTPGGGGFGDADADADADE